jgi:hypothetical protein
MHQRSCTGGYSKKHERRDVGREVSKQRRMQSYQYSYTDKTCAVHCGEGDRQIRMSGKILYSSSSGAHSNTIFNFRSSKPVPCSKLLKEYKEFVTQAEREGTKELGVQKSSQRSSSTHPSDRV